MTPDACVLRSTAWPISPEPEVVTGSQYSLAITVRLKSLSVKHSLFPDLIASSTQTTCCQRMASSTPSKQFGRDKLSSQTWLLKGRQSRLLHPKTLNTWAATSNPRLGLGIAGMLVRTSGWTWKTLRQTRFPNLPSKWSPVATLQALVKRTWRWRISLRWKCRQGEHNAYVLVQRGQHEMFCFCEYLFLRSCDRPGQQPHLTTQEVSMLN